MTTRDLDLVLHGATGFVGALTAAHLAAAAPAGTRIALSGRSAKKLRAVRDALGPAAAGWELVVADATDQDALDELARRTTAVITTVGPYAAHGMPLARACARAGTHYGDLTGEPLFVRRCIDELDATAVASGARIVSSCGFDSVPSDLSVLLLHQRVAADAAGSLGDTTMVAVAKGGVSGGTIASGRGQMAAVAADPSLGAVLADPYTLSPDRAREPDLGPQSDRALQRAATIDPSLTGWVASFLMAYHNTRIVRRSAALLDWSYGPTFRYREVMSTGSSFAAPVLAAGMAGALAGYDLLGPLVSRGVGLKVLDRVAPKPGTGPDEATREGGYFTLRTYTRTTTGDRYRATFAAQGDPGYKATAVLLGEAGLALALDGERLPVAAGVLTPATALGEVLADRLRAAGMTITVDRLR
ncbi:saccharopine dehydrogenase NADP-binding domain-containing protein [Rhodococcus antarcticus]|uniref:Saccharopine dehydrogenase NADP-binding domain-containing protein n=1 Tax=Rhodococcus antarcticus TaxID=2987751 RepID=A0ABY6P3K1_9NOCA|nr:saccharopine dehydrogenase NADP-binding domain-containing protein [Rhodococcus antarcticus]UZJ26245.1 saccharopine dehydrogenase NADP-binding domain-containing protein [Rhodococcus antarcticus]